jgi:rhodanese-related sulfurtransferase
MRAAGTLSAMSEPQAEQAPVEATEGELRPERVAELAGSGEVQIVDVRTTAEHAAGHVAGARHAPLDALAEEAGSLDRDRPVVFYCRAGERSAMAAEAFRASGWDAHSMAGGLVAWAEEGHPLEPEGGEVAHHSALPDR